MFRVNETDNIKMEEYADSILDYFLSNDISFDVYDYDDFAGELDNAIQNGEIVSIPELDREDAFQLAVEKSIEDAHSGSMYGDWDSSIKSDVWADGEDYSSAEDMLESTIKDSNEMIKLLSESLASKKAKKLGLVHVGFGNYSKDQGGSAQYKTINGKLKKINGAIPKKKKVEAPKKEKPKEKEEPKKKKPERHGIKNLRRVSGEKFTYEFEKDGRKYKFTLNKKERKELKDESSLMAIVKNRMKAKEEKQRSKQFKKGQHIEKK
jgi:hypothetical protein